MSSTFSGLEIAKRALFTQQSAIYTTSHNIANASTPGYSRQRVNFETVNPYPAPGRNRPEIAGQIGQGVQAGTVQRIRDQFVDLQYRTEHNKLGYWEARANALSQMEQILNEPSDNGLSAVINQFWEALNDLSVNPEDAGARSVVQQRGIAVANTFNYISDSLTAVQDDLASEMDVTTKKINSLLDQIQGLNDQIKAVEPHGYLPNDLYDERDVLIDELSQLVNIDVDYTSSGGQALEIAQGIANIRLVDANGNPVKDNSGNDLPYLLDLNNNYNELHVKIGKNANGQSVVNSINIGGQIDNNNNLVGGLDISPLDFIANGKLKGLVEAHGFDDGNGNAEGIYTTMLADIDKMAYAFATEFNKVHQQGYSLDNSIDNNGPGTPGQGIDFFHVDTAYTATNYFGYAGAMEISSLISQNEDYIAASTDATAMGNGENAINLANVKDNVISVLGNNTTIDNFYESIIGDMAVQAQEANRMTANAQTLQSAVDSRRQSISGVSLDEEMTNIVKFQHAYNAAARSLTAVDEMLDRIINQMGIVGR